MRSSFILGALALVACGGSQPRIYRVALDTTAAKTINNPSCYKANQVPATTEQSTNLIPEGEWVVWDGESGTQYLDVGTFSVNLADSPDVSFGELVKSSEVNKTFMAQRVRVNNQQNANSQISWQVVFNFDQMGALAVGNVNVNSQYLCQGTACPTGNFVPYTSCSAVLGFVGRQITVQQTTAYPNQGSTP